MSARTAFLWSYNSIASRPRFEPSSALDRSRPLGLAASNGTGPMLLAEGRLPWPVREVDDVRLEAALAASDGSDPFPGVGLYRADRHTASIAVEYVRTANPRFLHLGLGDTDEYGHRDDYNAYLSALRAADETIGALKAMVDSMPTDATFIITTDHGRGAHFRDHGRAFPASGRSFILAFGAGVPPRGVVCEHRAITLPDVGATARAILGLRARDARSSGTPIAELVQDEEDGALSSATPWGSSPSP